MDYVFLAIGFALLIKGADFLVSGSTMIARRLNVGILLTGLSVAAFGTSTAELFANIIACLAK